MSSEEFDPIAFFLILGIVLIVLPGIASFFMGLFVKVQRICEEDKTRVARYRAYRIRRTEERLQKRLH